MKSFLLRAHFICLPFVLILSSALAAQDAAPKLELKKGDHIAIIGNTLAERMQHDGWLETILHCRFPEHELVVRDLGFSGDEVTTRLRSAGFGTPDEWLSRVKADVVIACFGYNESFAGKEGLDKFKQDLDAFVKHTLSQNYSGKGAPRLVLVSPVPHEKLADPNLPDPAANNARLEMYTSAMADVAKANGVPLVDLFHGLAMRVNGEPLTTNGIHLNSQGNLAAAATIELSLFGGLKERESDYVAKIRQAVLDKNFNWFHRYRTTDGYSIYGGRADLTFVDGQTNRVVMQREMEVLDAMTANRDKRIWDAARNIDSKVDDSSTPPFIPVKTNKPGPLPGGLHEFVGGEAAIERMTVHPSMKVNLFASEEQFPELVNPVQMAVDTKGRIWVAAWPTYPHWKPKEEMNDKLLILEDNDGDGKADKCKTFAGDLHNPTGFEFWNGGVLVAMAPDILFLKDTNGDDVADVRQRVLHGIDSADTHHTANSFVLDPGGALYFQEGTFHHTQVETPWGPPQRCANAGFFRYEPRTHKFDVYITHGFANPHGHVFDRWGQDFVIDGTGANPYHAALFSGHLDFPAKHNRPPQLYEQRTRPCPGAEILSSKHFPPEMQGNMLVGNVIGFQGILQYQIRDKGSSFEGIEAEPILSSSDPNFRPTDFEIGSDGALYFGDWQNPIIGHMQHNLRDPSRDRTHGRVYRVTYNGRPLSHAPKIAGEPIEKLLDLLKEPEDRVRYRARIELSGRDSKAVIAAVNQWAGALDDKDPDYEHHLLEAVWVHQQHNMPTLLLNRVLASPDFRARAAGTRILCYWRDRVPSALGMLKKLAADEHPRVRLEAVRAASFFTEPEAVEVPLISAEHPSDEYLAFTRDETMRALEPHWKKALAEGKKIAFSSDAGARFFLRNVKSDELLKMDMSRAVALEVLYRAGIRDEQRQSAVAFLAGAEKKSELAILLDALVAIDKQPEGYDESVAFDLVRLLTTAVGQVSNLSRREGQVENLFYVRGQLQALATSAKQPLIRQAGYLGLIAADGNADKAWELAAKSVPTLRDLVSAVPLISDPSVRALLYPKVEPLLNGLPAELASARPATKGTYGRFVRIELPGRATLTLAEVEVISDGRNVARSGKASQKNTAHGGPASRGIDGNTSDSYGSGGQTHTEENTPDPWWEVDLGDEMPIESIAVYNRHDGDLWRRLEGFRLTVLDSARNIVFEREKNRAPRYKTAFDVGGGGPESLIRREAMLAVISIRGQETKSFETLAKFIQDNVDRSQAIRAIQRIPRSYWPAEAAEPLVTTLLAHVAKIPTADRTSPAALDAMQLVESLAALLPAERAKAIRKELGDLGVPVIRIGTIPHQMAFDKERIVIQAGKPVEFVLENSDIMPHNFAITTPGAMEEIGNAAEAMAQQPGALERQFIPQSNKILLASQLLQPRQSQKLSFTAPAQTGVYPYVCTYPGHWRRMYGALVVVENLDDYLADPDGYLAAHELPIKDELLKTTRTRTQWKVEDLAVAVEEMEGHGGRNFGNARQIFTVAACVSCHKLGGAGQEIGPDLTKLDEKWKSLDVLKELIDPSARINEKYQTFVLQTESGESITGLVLAETGDSVKVIENPLV
ncbi:MAG TPA: PVC-type heme-binding CxxCH protein, partial [Pirellulaceae bacterium]|nr:PVC-type heme-binding CxxCH protein [Pirellulaceae bacterium]